MKILRIIARLNVGGPARHVVWLTEALNDDEFTTTLIAGTVPDGEEDMSYFAERHNVSPVYIEEMSRELSAKDIVSLYKIYRVIKAEKPDIIHTHTAKAGTVGRLAAFLYRWMTWKKVRVVHTFHGHVFHSYYGAAKTKLFISIEKMLARFATDKIITITQQQHREIHEQVGVGRKEQFEVIPLGIDLSAFAGADAKRNTFRNEIGAADEEILIGFVGRLTEIKNIPLLLKAAQIYLADPDAPKARFVIVGDGHLRAELESNASGLGISDDVLFAGNRVDADVIYAGLDVVALTSLNEGTPLSLIEAMASGRAVMSTAVGGVVDLLGGVKEDIDGFSVCERGIAVPSEAADEFAKGLIYLAKNEKLRLGLGETGRDFVVANYGKERLIEDIKALYRRLS
ncbi:MAG TPA: glycosyltransferase [Pyrinomonadaceae bacterium]|nr:glycosyltransferase [Pyrinomonadaceae bacterium]